MKVKASNESSSEDEDIFLQGGLPKPISMYSSNLAKDSEFMSSSDEDDAEDEDDIVEVVTKRRGRPTKRGRTSVQAGTARKGASSAEPPKPKKEKTSVFEVSSGEDNDDVVEVSSRDACDELDPQFASAAASLAEARAVLANQANEERIAAEAENFAKVEAERAERIRKAEIRQKEEERKRWEAEKQKARAAANAKPIQLKVRCGANLIKMRIRVSDPLIKMLAPFCKKFGLDIAKAVMQVEGEDVGELDTVDTHDLEENMLVDVVIRS